MTTQTTATETQIQIQIALEVLKMDETGKTKAAIAKEFGVSPRSVNRYADKYEEEAMDLFTAEDESETELRKAFDDQKEALEEKIEGVDAEETQDESSEDDVQKEETESEVEEKEEPKVETKTRKRASIERDANGLTKNQIGILATYYKQKGTMDKTETRQAKTGRAKKGVKTIRYITMEILEAHAEAGTLTKANKASIIEEIMKAGDVTEATAKQYFSGHKIMFGGFQG